jgi:hypothetical protein
MPQLIFLGLFLYLVVQLFVMAVAVLFAALPLAVVGFATAHLALFAHRQWLCRRIGCGAVPDAIGGAFSVSIVNDRLVLTEDRAVLARLAADKGPVAGALVLAGAAILLAALFLGSQGAFHGVTFFEYPVSGAFICLVASVPAGVAVIAATLASPSQRRLEAALIEDVRALLDRSGAIVIPELERLAAVESEILDLGRRIDVGIPVDHLDRVRQRAADLGATTIRDPKPLQLYIQRELTEAEQVRDALANAVATYEGAISAFHAAEKAVRQHGSKVLHSRLDEAYDLLTNSGLRDLLALREWSEFHALVLPIRDELQRLAADARRGMGSAAGPGARRDWGTMTVEEALAVIGVPASASAAQIKSVYHSLAKAWHADTGGDHERMAELSRAMRTLRDAGRVT